MTVEVGTTISALNSSKPVDGDPVSEGNDHLQLIKGVLKTQFPGVGGNGFATEILATEAEINNLQGQENNINDEFAVHIALIAAAAGGGFDSGTTMLFRQFVVPVGWSQVDTWDDSLVIINAPSASGGSHSPTSKSFAHTHVVTTPVQSAHEHDTVSVTASGGATAYSPSFGATGEHGHITTSDSGGITYTPKYVNFLLGEKD